MSLTPLQALGHEILPSSWGILSTIIHYVTPSAFSAFREGETSCRHPGFDCLHHGDPAGLRVHGDGARDGGERAGAAPGSLSAAAERYSCYSRSREAALGCVTSGTCACSPWRRDRLECVGRASPSVRVWLLRSSAPALVSGREGQEAGAFPTRVRPTALQGKERRSRCFLLPTQGAGRTRGAIHGKPFVPLTFESYEVCSKTFN